MKSNNHSQQTLSIHQGESEARAERAVVGPIYQSSTYLVDEGEPYHKIRYGRMNNSPAHVGLHQKLAALEGTEGAMTFASGMAAITTAIMAAFEPGDHFLVQNCVYGGTGGFLSYEAKRLGLEYTYVDIDDPGGWEKNLKGNTKGFYIESVSNPLLEIPDFEQVVDFAKSKNLTTLIDNTFPSPTHFQPRKHGIDVVLHSATKYLNGHSDVIAGAAMASTEFIEKMRRKLIFYGATLAPQDVFLLNRGIKTLSIRMREHNKNGLELAEFLNDHSAVDEVYYPGIKENKYHERAKKYFAGFGGMLSFTLKDPSQTPAFLEKLHLPSQAPSLGGVESLVGLPAKSSHAGLSRKERELMGISDHLIRFSCGLEDINDLREDFTQALG